ncbi:MAG: hypothetical protein EZS28_017400 [Streblomastix strix]|uniref:Uncharacterized protein n=1 Tax=Streblomastix strix TaxID=222440 RepID=A0A5J4VXK7_9EUKA|nr:MAG: hypothetical protein EZS28_017400 [Streblomastix strix]
MEESLNAAVYGEAPRYTQSGIVTQVGEKYFIASEEKKSNSRFRHFFDEYLNFAVLHFIIYLLITLIFSIILFLTEKEMEYIDALLLSVSALVNCGLTPIDLTYTSMATNIFVFIENLVGGATIQSLIPVIIRIIYHVLPQYNFGSSTSTVTFAPEAASALLDAIHTLNASYNQQSVISQISQLNEPHAIAQITHAGYLAPATNTKIQERQVLPLYNFSLEYLGMVTVTKSLLEYVAFWVILGTVALLVSVISSNEYCPSNYKLSPGRVFFWSLFTSVSTFNTGGSCGLSIIDNSQLPMGVLSLLLFSMLASMYPFILTLHATTIPVDNPNAGQLMTAKKELTDEKQEAMIEAAVDMKEIT